MDAQLSGRRRDGRRCDLDAAPLGERAIVLSEFGGVAMAHDIDGTAFGFGTANWSYDNAATSDELLVRRRELWAAVHASSVLAGACWTQLTDTDQEVNGLLRADRTAKADVDAIAAAVRGRDPAGPLALATDSTTIDRQEPA